MEETGSNSFARGVNKPLFVACLVMGAGLLATFARDMVSMGTGVTRNDSRIVSIEEYISEHKRVSISREEFNRLDQQVQSKAGREELMSIQKRIDDIRSDLAEIKTAVMRDRR